jgi:hypothetical protein
MVVINPSTIPKLSCTTLANGAKQLVVHEALDTTFKFEVYYSWLTPITNIGVSSLGGALMTTFLAPPPRCFPAVSEVVNTPLDSQT